MFMTDYSSSESDPASISLVSRAAPEAAELERGESRSRAEAVGQTEAAQQTEAAGQRVMAALSPAQNRPNSHEAVNDDRSRLALPEKCFALPNSSPVKQTSYASRSKVTDMESSLVNLNNDFQNISTNDDCNKNINIMAEEFKERKLERLAESSTKPTDKYFEHTGTELISKEELGSISVKNMAKYWEDISRKIKADAEKTDCKIQKKWNSMPDLKDRYEKRKLPVRPTQEKIQHLETKNEESLVINTKRPIVKSDEVIDDVDLCRSVSLRDRRQMFEMVVKQAKREKAKQWSSMPSLKQENSPQLAERNQVHWKEESEPEERLPVVRGKSPIKDIARTFEPRCGESERSPTAVQSPVSPLVHSNEVFTYREDVSQSDSLSSSLTSGSTVIPASPRVISSSSDSRGEIYTDGNTETPTNQHGLFVLENSTRRDIFNIDEPQQFSLVKRQRHTKCRRNNITSHSNIL